MKVLITKISAALLAGWYIVSVIGFGVHTCNEEGRSFVVAFYEEMTCEEVHPEHVSHHSGCCHCCHEEVEGLCIRAASCCSNDYQALELTGAVISDDSRGDDVDVLRSHPCPGVLMCSADSESVFRTTIKYVHEPGSGYEGGCDRQALLSIWRI